MNTRASFSALVTVNASLQAAADKAAKPATFSIFAPK